MEERSSLSNVFDQLTTTEWSDWLDDLLSFGYARPEFPFEPHRSPSEKMTVLIDFLRRSHIKMDKMTKAANSLLENNYTASPIYADHIDALLHVASWTKAPVFKPILLNFFHTRQIRNLKATGKDYSLYSAVVQTLAVQKFSKSEIDNILQELLTQIHELNREQIIDPSLLAQTLEFASEHGKYAGDKYHHFFRLVDSMLNLFDSRLSEENTVACLSAISGQFQTNAILYRSEFFNSLYKWLIKSHLELKNNPAYQTVLVELHHWMYETEDDQSYLLNTNRYAKASWMYLESKFLVPPTKNWPDFLDIIPIPVMEWEIGKKSAIGAPSIPEGYNTAPFYYQGNYWLNNESISISANLEEIHQFFLSPDLNSIITSWASDSDIAPTESSQGKPMNLPNLKHSIDPPQKRKTGLLPKSETDWIIGSFDKNLLQRA
ncbi:MAG: hypothetical protein ACKVT2_05830 [Saprospiraceae bacterium]